MNQQFGQYRILAPLAQGGMARVFKAALPGEGGRDQLVALKRIRVELAEDAEFLERFMDEARISSTLQHENIVRVMDFGSVEGEPYLAMELVEGLDLRSFLRQHGARGQPVPLWAAIYICAQMARGLEAAHCRVDASQQPAPVIHRDISPQNVLISWDGQVKITDFGVAKAAEKVLRTRTGVILGKWRYMAPEQAQGGAIDCRADVFSVGCVLYELLTGSPLFDGQYSEKILQEILHKTIPSVGELRAEVPPLLKEIYRRALSRPLDQRQAHAGVLAEELFSCLASTAPEASPARLGELVRALAKPPKASSGEVTLALAETVESASSEARTAIKTLPLAEQQTAISPPGALFAAQPTALFDAAREPALDPDTEPRRRPWKVRAAGAALLLGGLGALLGAILGFTGAQPVDREVSLGQQLQHGGWTLQFDQLKPLSPDDHLELGLQVQGPGGEPPSLGDLLLLQRGRELVRPLYAARKIGTTKGWRIIFPGKPSPELRLRFAPASAPLLHLRLRP